MNEPEEDVTVDVDGVSLRKALNDHQFETLAVVFDIRSGGAAGVTLTDTIPEGVVAEDIGFHPEYGGEHWRAEGGEVVFSRDFEPGEQYTTVYGVRDFDGDRGELLAEPSVDVDVGGSVGDIDDLVSEEDSDLVREVIAGERDTLPGLEAEAAGEPAVAGADDGPDESAEAGVVPTAPTVGDDDAVEATDDAEADDDEEPEASEAETDDDVPAEVPGTVAGDSDDDTAAEEEPAVDADDDTDDDAPDVAVASVEADDEAEPAEGGDEVTVPITGGIARVLAKELRAGNVSHEDRRLLREELLPDDGSTDARIRRLQNQVADLAAYTDALEAFLDAEGGAEAVIGDVEDEVADLAEDLSGLEGSVDDVSERVDGVAADVDQVEGDLDEVVGDVEEVSATTGRLTRDVDDLRDDVARIDGLDRRLEGVEDDVAAIRDELEGLAEFRERLSSVFGAGGGVGGGAGAPAESDDVDDSDDDYGY